jgi:hypothetical protein
MGNFVFVLIYPFATPSPAGVSLNTAWAICVSSRYKITSTTGVEVCASGYTNATLARSLTTLQ